GGSTTFGVETGLGGGRVSTGGGGEVFTGSGTTALGGGGVPSVAAGGRGFGVPPPIWLPIVSRRSVGMISMKGTSGWIACRAAKPDSNRTLSNRPPWMAVELMRQRCWVRSIGSASRCRFGGDVETGDAVAPTDFNDVHRQLEFAAG